MKYPTIVILSAFNLVTHSAYAQALYTPAINAKGIPVYVAPAGQAGAVSLPVHVAPVGQANPPSLPASSVPAMPSAAPVTGRPMPSAAPVTGAPVNALSVPASMSTQAPPNTQAINVTSKTFTLSLPSNPTTGYHWYAKQYDTQLISVVGHRYVAANQKMIGSSGTELWTFTLSETAFSSPHVLLITMRYVRSFDPDNGTDKTITVFTK